MNLGDPSFNRSPFPINSPPKFTANLGAGIGWTIEAIGFPEISNKVWVRVVSIYDFQMVPSPLASLQLLAYYRLAMGILLVYDVTDESSVITVKV
ncbi:hypothetical protein L2E82_12245 [Cichorium intybus]|uniref:Uncharacterized protein n=1 Tax=Cichorium intybus TaxID=13427 RepID=A0ACB9GGN8_CICIN|nr:hypothetical protein L2E82_12245 [Cichorium intybus]